MTHERNNWEVVQHLNVLAPRGVHTMCVVGNYIYVIDGDKLCRMYHPPETIWQKIWKLIKF